MASQRPTWLTLARSEPLAVPGEQTLKGHFGVRHVVCTSSCTTGLILPLRCLSPGSHAIVSSLTFCATMHAIVWNNLIPLFADCHAFGPSTATLFDRRLHVEKKIWKTMLKRL
jgi:dTDP-4-amino-4,6-dideoxygalactose transaminase